MKLCLTALGDNWQAFECFRVCRLVCMNRYKQVLPVLLEELARQTLGSNGSMRTCPAQKRSPRAMGLHLNLGMGKNMQDGRLIVKSRDLLYTDVVGKDACGIGGIATGDGSQHHDVVSKALGALRAMEHRGGICGESGDGAGLTCQMPQGFFRQKHVSCSQIAKICSIRQPWLLGHCSCSMHQPKLEQKP